MAAGGEEAVPVGDETDEQETGDEDEGRPVLGCGGPGVVRGQQHRRQEEHATAGGGSPAPGAVVVHRVILLPMRCTVGLCPVGAPRKLPADLGATAADPAAGQAAAGQAAALTSVVSSALESAFHSAQ